MANCPSTCGEIEIIGNPTSNCQTTQRRIIPARFLFYPCSIDLPDPIEGNIKPLFDDGTIAWTSVLRNFTFNDPTTQDLIVDDCTPPLTIISGREVTVEDTAAITYGVSSPLVENPFWDYFFWNGIINQQLQLRVMIAYCDGDVRIAKDADGNPLIVTIYGFVNYEAPAVSGGKRLEFKRLVFKFNGDPINFSVTRAFNLVDEGIEL